MIRPREDRRETRRTNGSRRIIPRIDEPIVIGQRAILTNVTFRLNLIQMPRRNTMITDLGHCFESTQTAISNLIGGDIGTLRFSIAQRFHIP